MTDPFASLGGAGGFDMSALLEQAQAMQSQLQDAQERLAETELRGAVAGGAVGVTVNGIGELVGVDVRAGEFDGSDPDQLADLSDMIVAAYRDARAQADALAGDALGPLAGGDALGSLTSGGGAPDGPGRPGGS